MDVNQPFEPTLSGAVVAHRLLVGVFAVAGAILAVIAGLTVFNNWVATASVIVEDPQRSSVFGQPSNQDPRRYVADQVAIIESPGIARTAAEATSPLVADLPMRELLRLRQVGSNPESGLIEVSVRHEDPEVAIALANEIIDAYRSAKDERSAAAFNRAVVELDSSIAGVEAALDAIELAIIELANPGESYEELLAQVDNSAGLTPEELNRLLQRLQAVQLAQVVRGLDPELAALLEIRALTVERRAQLELRRDQLGVDAALATSGVVLASTADVAERSPGVGRLAVIGLLIGFLVGVAVAYRRSLRSRLFEQRREPEAILNAPLLAEVPNFGGEGLSSVLPVRDAPLSAAAEAYRFAGAALSDRIDLAGLSGELESSPSQIFAFTSPLIADGKTVTVANVGAALATKGKRVLLIDADFGDQALTGLIAEYKGWHPGLTDVVEVGVPLTSAVRTVHVRDGLSVDLLSRGNQSIAAPEFFRRESVRALFSEIRSSYDLILLDAPPMLQVAYSGSVVRLCDSVVAVVSHGGDANALVEAAERIALTGRPIAGYIYNKAPLRDEMLLRTGSMRDPLGLGVPPDVN
jgi:Mrp family chromosome partitioning ATPase